MKKILFPALLIGTLVAGGLVALAIWRASPMTSEEYFADGKKLFDAKQYSEARIQFLNAVKLDGRNRDARLQLARTFLNMGDINSAGRQLVTLLENFPDDIEASLELGNIYLAVATQDPKYLKDAADLAGKILAKDPNNVNGLILSGNAASGMRDYTTSVEQFEKAISLDPKSTMALISLGNTRAFQKQLPEAEQAFLKAREVDPKNRGALVALANYYRQTGNMAKAEEYLQEAIAEYPADSTIYTQLVQLYFQTNRADQGVTLLKNLQAKDPKNPRPTFLLADLFEARQQPQEARAVLLELKKGLPDNLDLAAKLAANTLRDDPARAQAEIDQILKAEPNNAMGNLLLGELQYLSGKYPEAEKTLAKDIVINSRYPEAQFFLGNLAARNGETAKAETYFQKALQLNPNYLAARVGLSELLFNKGRVAEARAQLGMALEASPGFGPARLLKVALDRAEKRFPEAEAELNSLVKEQPQNALVHLQMALYNNARGRTADAEKSFQRVLELQPDSEDALRSLVSSYVRGKNFDQAIKTITDIPEAKRGALHYELLGAVYTQAGKEADAETAFKKAVEKDPNRSGADALLAQHYLANGKTQEGLAALDEMIKKSPATSSGALGTKGLIYEGMGKIAEAKQSYNAALQANPNFEPAANNLAYILAEEGTDLVTALNHAQNARRRQPESPNIADTLGWVYHKMNNQVLAREQLLFAVSRQPENPIFQYHLGMIYKATNQTNEARDAFRKALASKQEFKERPLVDAALKEVVARR